MKVGDTVPVTLGGHVVAQAKVAEMASDRATLVIPQTVVVMAVRTELDAAPSTATSETVITGVDRPETLESSPEVVNNPPAVEAPEQTVETQVVEAPVEAAEQPAPVVDKE